MSCVVVCRLVVGASDHGDPPRMTLMDLRIVVNDSAAAVPGVRYSQRHHDNRVSIAFHRVRAVEVCRNDFHFAYS